MSDTIQIPAKALAILLGMQERDYKPTEGPNTGVVDPSKVTLKWPLGGQQINADTFTEATGLKPIVPVIHGKVYWILVLDRAAYEAALATIEKDAYDALTEPDEEPEGDDDSEDDDEDDIDDDDGADDDEESQDALIVRCCRKEAPEKVWYVIVSNGDTNLTEQLAALDAQGIAASVIEAPIIDDEDKLVETVNNADPNG
jgi:hypothetical protein